MAKLTVLFDEAKGKHYIYYGAAKRRFYNIKPCPRCGEFMNWRSSRCRDCYMKEDDRFCDRRGENHWNWKGGRTVSEGGYILVLRPDHPRAHGRPGYVYEHIIVMEGILGRPLGSDEQVHHKNGIKDDNSIDNLELWDRSQPNGGRVSDKIEWALELLKKYDPDNLA